MPVHDESPETTKRRALAQLLALFPPAGGTDAASIEAAVNAHMHAASSFGASTYVEACRALVLVWDQRTLPPPARTIRACREYERSVLLARRAIEMEVAAEAMCAEQMTAAQARELLRAMPESTAPNGSLEHTLQRVSRNILLQVIEGGSE